jgi:hypothetical protein
MFRCGATLAIFGFLTMSAQIKQGFTAHEKPSINRTAQDRVAQLIDAMRQEDGLHRLKRRRPSREEVQLVCTAAVAGVSVHEPKFGALEVYLTDDLSERTEPLKLVAFGTTYNPQSGTRYPVYSERDWRSYDVVVYSRVAGDGTEHFTVGVSRHSRANDLFGWMTFDRPVSNSLDWKRQIAPECMDQRP